MERSDRRCANRSDSEDQTIESPSDGQLQLLTAEEEVLAAGAAGASSGAGGAGAMEEARESGSSLRRRLARVAAGTMALRVTAVFLNLLVNVFMARLLGAHSFGVYAVVLAWCLVLAVPAGLGFDRLLIRELARMRAGADPVPLRSLIRTAMLAGTGASALAGLVLLLAAFVVGDGDPAGSFGAIALGALVIPLMTLTTLWQSAVQGVNRVTRGLLAETLIRPATLLGLVVLALVLTRISPPAVAGTLLLAIASAVGLIGAVLLWRRLAPAVLRAPARSGAWNVGWPSASSPGGPGVWNVGRPSASSPVGSSAPSAGRPEGTIALRTGGGWLRVALPLTALATISVISSQADIVLVGMLLDPESAGIYAIAVRVSLLVSFPLTVLNTALAPTYASLIAAGDLVRLQRLVTTTIRGVTVATVVVGAVFIALGEPVLGVFGGEFRAGAPALVILVAGQLSNAILGPTGTLMVMSGNERRAAAVVGIGAIIEIVLVVLLSRPFGLVGVAIGSTLGLIAWNVLMLIDIRRRLGIRPTALGL